MASEGECSAISEKSEASPKIYSMQIESKISHRFARTLIISKVRNLQKEAKETTFSVIIPENAFITEFEMEIKGKVYKAYVKEKEEAKAIYQEAVSSGQSAAHVELSARDSKTFTVSVNVEPENETIFRLVYEELLERQNGKYELVLNIHPGQIVEDLGVEVRIDESRPLTFVKTLCLRTGNEIREDDEKLKPSAEIDVVTNNSAIVRFTPDVDQQSKFAEYLEGDKNKGFAGQFVVQYDVERDPQGGEILIRDGYFVHFFAPSELEPLPKHIVFVLDHSGSMRGRKIGQLIEAMQKILSELNPQDLFNIVRFSESAYVWNPEENSFIQAETDLNGKNLCNAVEATTENIEKAKDVVRNTRDLGNTNIFAGLEVGLLLIKKTQDNIPNKYQPLIIFLTDGMANMGITSTDEITKTVTKINSGTDRAAIFSLSFGDGADKEFLKKLSSSNLGFSKHIYEASDASLQLQDFYHTISSPLLKNISFKYVESVSDVTETDHPLLFQGSELVVTGRIGEKSDLLLHVNGTSKKGPVVFNNTLEESKSPLERLWAYLTVKKLLKEKENVTDGTEFVKKALSLCLKYSFVTSVSSLVVVKADGTNSVDPQDAKMNEVSDSGMDFRCMLKKRKYCCWKKEEVPSVMPKSAPKFQTITKVDYLNDLDDSTFHKKFRLMKQTCQNILSYIESDLSDVSDSGNIDVTPMDQLLLTLYFYGSRGNVDDVAHAMTVDRHIAIRIIRNVTEFLIELSPCFVKMPQKEDFQAIQEKFYHSTSFPKVVGVLGTTHIRVQPSCDDEIYNNPKGYFSVKCQIICDADTKILDIFSGLPGSENDIAIFNYSEIKTKFESGQFPNCVLLGDGYEGTSYSLTPFRQAVTDAEQRYNDSHSKVLSVIEKFFDSWKKRFPILAYGSEVGIRDIRKIAAATAVLHNIALNMNEAQPPPPEGIDSDELDILIKEGQISEVTVNLPSEATRSQFANDYFSKE